MRGVVHTFVTCNWFSTKAWYADQTGIPSWMLLALTSSFTLSGGMDGSLLTFCCVVFNVLPISKAKSGMAAFDNDFASHFKWKDGYCGLCGLAEGFGQSRRAVTVVTTVPLAVGYGALNLLVRSLDR